jgi:hypothetical protein
VFTPESVSVPVVVFVSPADPDRMLEIVPAWPSSGTPLLASVPLAIVPPAIVTVPVRASLIVPRFSTPPFITTFAAALPSANVLLKVNWPAVTVVAPE